MKKTFVLFLCLAFTLGCSSEKKTKNYVSLSGTIQNHKQPEIIITSTNDKDFKKKIKVDSKGRFSDTLKVNKQYKYYCEFNEFKDHFGIYLKNGFDLTLNFDADQHKETKKYSGLGSNYNNYMLA